ncbi:MAG TPA: HlyD family efflux transporter periplasmic adaptor subunit [Anaerovoracaceae bacterium]|nr:HlyD family efflux transporter periplasmic adaptor subunit [Anaerovoracaceae bacterium]
MNHIANHKKKIIPLLALIVVIAFIAFFYGRGGQNYIGVVEATILSNTSEVSGKILEMPVELGQHVSKGDLIAKIDSTDQEYSYEQLKLTLDKKKLALSDLEVGTSRNSQAENSISIAQSNYNSAASSSQKAALDYKNAQSLYNQGAIPKDVLDSAKVKADSAANALTAAKAQLDSAKSGTSASSTQLDIEQTESQLQEMKDTLDKFTLLAVSDGVIMSKSYVLGDMVSPGFNLADIAADGQKYFVFYLPIDYMNSIDYDRTYTVKANGEEYKGVVKYIDVESEYTPKDMQTAANKNRESVKIKLLLPNDCPLKPGEEAEIDLNLKKIK